MYLYYYIKWSIYDHPTENHVNVGEINPRVHTYMGITFANVVRMQNGHYLFINFWYVSNFFVISKEVRSIKLCSIHIFFHNRHMLIGINPILKPFNLWLDKTFQY